MDVVDGGNLSLVVENLFFFFSCCSSFLVSLVQSVVRTRVKKELKMTREDTKKKEQKETRIKVFILCNYVVSRIIASKYGKKRHDC